MPFFKDIQTLYLHVPKTGGTSIETFFYNKLNISQKNTENLYGWYLSKAERIRVPDDRTLQHFTYAEIIGEKYRYYFPESIKNPNTRILVSVRNPYDRMVSELFWNNHIPLDRRNPTPEKVEAAIRFFLHEDTSVQDHRTPQYNYILDENGMPLKNINVVRCETLTADMHALGHDTFAEHVNANGIYSPPQYRELLNAASKKMIEDYYKDDFDYFGYIRDSNTIENAYSKATIVTAYISNINTLSINPIEKYIENGRRLLAISAPMVCFIEEDIYVTYFAHCVDQYPLTTFVFTKKSDIYLYDYKDDITEFSLVTDDPNKNTLEYMFVQCNKTEWVRKAIKMNPYNTSQFIWVDFGIHHMIRDEDRLRRGIEHMVRQEYDTLRIASGKYKGYSVPYDVYRIITWTFCGSVFGGPKDALVRFADLTKAEVLATIRDKKSLMWEINIWYLIYRREGEFMDFYSTGHDIRILDSY
jgi:Bacterial protein of unknown function (HtrL_YibB)